MRNIFDKQYENLTTAYRKTIYRCLDSKLDIYIDQLTPELDELLLERDYENLTILTTYNPASVIRSPTENQQSSKELISELEQVGYDWLRGVNIDPKGEFPEEHSCWIFGLEIREGLSTARKWNQNAFVHCRLYEPPELVWVK